VDNFTTTSDSERRSVVRRTPAGAQRLFLPRDRIGCAVAGLSDTGRSDRNPVGVLAFARDFLRSRSGNIPGPTIAKAVRLRRLAARSLFTNSPFVF